VEYLFRLMEENDLVCVWGGGGGGEVCSASSLYQPLWFPRGLSSLVPDACVHALLLVLLLLMMTMLMMMRMSTTM
jgi:hypothetical protein